MTHTRPGDRWLEMDLTCFDPQQPFPTQIDDVFDRLSPLLANVAGDRGIFFNLGWLIDLVTEWTGDIDQLIPTRSRRTAAWAEVSYGRLAEFIDEFRRSAERHGLGAVRCGILFVDWAHVVWPPELKIYDFDSDWYERHPELYEAPKSHIGMPDLHPVNPLRGDDYPYATAPQGIADGTSFPSFFGPQWASFAEATGFDAILLRDGFCGPMIYTRNGPYGTVAPSDPAVVARFSDAVRALFREVKQAAPDRLVFGYSSAISPVADWRVGCVDFEALVADGFIDAWIEQTWGGAWQDWWHQLWKGWTFQTANLLTRGVMIQRANEQRARPCSHYHLVETWDGWEHWDTIHQVPSKLTWGAWAFAHASALTPGGPRVTDGAYVSWMNQGPSKLLSDDDIDFMAGLLDRTETSAAAIEHVHGPAIVYDRSVIETIQSSDPSEQYGEWIDDQAGMLMKWGVPVLAATRPEWVDTDDGRLLLSQPPSADGAASTLVGRAAYAVFGRADAVASDVADELGVHPTTQRVAADFWVSTGRSDDTPPYDRPYLPEHVVVDVAADATVHYASEMTPLITTRGDRLWWQPTDWSEPFNEFVPKYQIGSTYPAFCVADLLHGIASRHAQLHVVDIDRPQPIAVHAWRSGGVDHLLVGNLETGEFGDSRRERTAIVRLGAGELVLGTSATQLVLVDGRGPDVVRLTPAETGEFLECEITLPPESGAVYHVSDGDDG